MMDLLYTYVKNTTGAVSWYTVFSNTFCIKLRRDEKGTGYTV